MGKMNSKLRLESHIASVVTKLLNPDKVCRQSMSELQKLSAALGEREHSTHPFPAACLNVSSFIIGASLGDVLCAGFQETMLAQTPAGQVFALQCVYSDLTHSTPRCISTTQFSELCVASGLLANFKAHVAPGMFLGTDRVQALERDFLADSAGSLTREEFCKMAKVVATLENLTPESAIAAFGSHVPSVLQMQNEAKRALNASVSAQNPAVLMARQAEAALATEVWLAQVKLDVNTYLTEYENAAVSLEDRERSYKRKMDAHVQDVKDAMKEFMSTRLVMKMVEKKVGRVQTQRWLTTLGVSGREQVGRVASIMNISPRDIASLHILNLSSLGTLKVLVNQGLADAFLPHMDDAVVWVEYPTMPSGCTITSDVAMAASASTDSEFGNPDCDEGPEANDFDSQGLLPEAFTRAHSLLTASQRSSRLAVDQLAIDRTIGHANMAARYPRGTAITMTCATGTTEVRRGIVLCPVVGHGAVGGSSADIGQADVSGLDGSTLVLHGTFSGVPRANFMVVATKANVLKAKLQYQDRSKEFVRVCESQLCHVANVYSHSCRL